MAENAAASDDDLESLEQLRIAAERVREELGKVIVGQQDVIEQLLIAIFAEGHCLLEGVPGLAKTLMVSTLAQSLSLQFSRIQFTPDLMPSDITGTEVIQENRATGEREAAWRAFQKSQPIARSLRPRASASQERKVAATSLSSAEEFRTAGFSASPRPKGRQRYSRVLPAVNANRDSASR